MAAITVNSRRATLAAISVPRIGAWVADVELDSAEALTGAVSLVIDGATWTGTVVRGGVAAGAWRGRIVGGAGGLSTVLTAVAQRAATLGTVLADVLRAAGETLASDAGVLTDARPLWHRLASPAQSAIADVATSAGYAWRVKSDGAVWLGAESWATYTPTGAVDVLDESPEAGRLVLSGDVLGILPGRTLVLPRRGPARVGQVELRATPTTLRAVIYAEPEGERTTGLGAAVDAVVARAMRRIDRLALYPARVVSQSAAGLLDLQPDDARVPSCQGVPIRHGLPGVTVTVAAGQRVLLGYEGGDPALPYAALWAAGAVTAIKINGATTKAAREGDDVTRTAALATWMTQVTGYINGVSPGTVTPAAPSVIGAISEGSDALRIP